MTMNHHNFLNLFQIIFLYNFRVYDKSPFFNNIPARPHPQPLSEGEGSHFPVGVEELAG